MEEGNLKKKHRARDIEHSMTRDRELECSNTQNMENLNFEYFRLTHLTRTHYTQVLVQWIECSMLKHSEQIKFKYCIQALPLQLRLKI